MGWKAGILFPEGFRGFSILYSEWTGSGFHPAPYSMDAMELSSWW
jgi:hypothetical protein